VLPLEPAQTLGEQARARHLRFGVFNAGIALVFGLVLAETHGGQHVGWLIGIPLAFAAYGILAGALGVCAMTGMRGERAADHGTETILDRGCARSVKGKAALLVALSLSTAVIGAVGFVASQ
jgi:hypothetical protein